MPQFITPAHDVQEMCILSRQSAMAWNAVIDHNNTDSQTTRKTSVRTPNTSSASLIAETPLEFRFYRPYAQLTDYMQSSCRSQRKTTQRLKILLSLMPKYFKQVFYSVRPTYDTRPSHFQDGGHDVISLRKVLPPGQ